ncbi:MAG: BrnT family toxin [Candidatus Acidiferrales bacterium]
MLIRFEWDENKNQQNRRKHDVRFETALLVFEDPYAISQRDFAFDQEERWITVGNIGPGAILLVVHTYHETQDEEIIRIISARAAESHERQAYEQAQRTAEARHPRDRRKKRRRH